jgi:hypothetical protein
MPTTSNHGGPRIPLIVIALACTAHEVSRRCIHGVRRLARRCVSSAYDGAAVMTVLQTVLQSLTSYSYSP